MADEGFLRRWARRKAESRTAVEPSSAPSAPSSPVPTAGVPSAGLPSTAAPSPTVPAALVQPPPERLPTMDDVARLTGESDFSAFVARGVDAAVRRTALKKLFADPHFNTMDRLDVYIDDYTAPSPVTEAMLASLAHAKQALRGAVATLDDGQDGQDGPAPAERPPDATPPAPTAA